MYSRGNFFSQNSNFTEAVISSIFRQPAVRDEATGGHPKSKMRKAGPYGKVPYNDEAVHKKAGQEANLRKDPPAQVSMGWDFITPEMMHGTLAPTVFSGGLLFLQFDVACKLAILFRVCAFFPLPLPFQTHTCFLLCSAF